MKKPLYIFLHIPKCAGSTLAYHIQKNLRPNQYKALYARDFAFGFDHETQIAEAYKEVSRLTSVQKDELLVLYGHAIPYGIHKYFPTRDVRYVTFLRDPISRIVSCYNFQRMRLTKHLSKPNRRYFRQFISENSRLLSFQDWLANKYNRLPNLPVGVSMAIFLQELGYLNKGHLTKGSLSQMRLRFWYIGQTEHFDHDILWFYRELGIGKFFKNKNVSKSYVKNTKHIIKEIALINKEDGQLYEYFKTRHTSLDGGSMKWKRLLMQPITQGFEDALTYLFQRSAQLKRRSALYQSIIKTIRSYA